MIRREIPLENTDTIRLLTSRVGTLEGKLAGYTPTSPIVAGGGYGIDLSTLGLALNGVTDDTVALQAAHDTAPAGSALVWEGAMRLNSTMRWTRNDLALIGTGKGSVILSGSATGDIITIGDGTSKLSGLLFRDFRIWSAVPKTSGWAINARMLGVGVFQNVRIGDLDSFVSDGSRLFGGILFDRFERIAFLGGEVLCNDDGIVCNGNADQSFGAELILDSGLQVRSVNNAAVRLAGACGGIYLQQVSISASRKGVVADQSRTAAINRELFISPGCTIDDCPGTGLQVDSLALLEATGGWVSGCGLATEPGVLVSTGSGVSARWGNMRVQQSVGDGVELRSGAHVWTGGFVSNNGLGTGGGYGLLGQPGVSQLTIAGVQFGNNGNATRGYGLYLTPGIDNFSVTADFYSNGQGPLYGDTAPGPTRMVKPGRGYITATNGYVTVPSGQSSLTVNHGLSGVPTVVEFGYAGVPDSAQAYVAPGDFTASNFTLRLTGNATTARDFWWRAERGALVSQSAVPGTITIDPLVTRSGNNYTFTARRSSNLGNAENRMLTLASSTAYPPGATAADFGGSFPSATAAFAAGAATAAVSFTSPIAQPE